MRKSNDLTKDIGTSSYRGCTIDTACLKEGLRMYTLIKIDICI